MRVFGLTPDQVLARTPMTLWPRRAPGTSRHRAIVFGAAALGGVSTLAYSVRAFRWVGATAPLYASVAAIYLGLGGIALGRLVPGAGATARFAALFAAGFALYAAAWCAAWFGLGGRHRADLWGAAAGVALLTWLMRRAFGCGGGFLPAFAVVFLFHTLGYTLGEVLHGAVRGTTGRLLWGAAHGLGFGAGLGALLHECQEPLRKLFAASGARAAREV